ncbi:phosphate ABC transporter substrate-binding/OmpA family protein [Inquilinus limosus]|uniref:phosphate ABC transporter substrate-binding/OmpA family protein n=1 Tax=Inquilinus limosus TaxID=171674 RepID=UPI00041EAFCE|nr:phosphate ABC transporter substrate-binding/OmpA family protein [Inquilinus limosus]
MIDKGPHNRSGGSPLGVILTLLLGLAVAGLGAWLYLGKGGGQGSETGGGQAPVAQVDAPDPVEPITGSPALAQPAAYVPKNGVVEIDISEYAGYGGLIVANGGLEPNPNSFFARQYGFQVKLSVSEEESWSKLNNGRFAAAATTTDVLAALGRQFEVVVPAQIAFSRGADMVVVDRGVASINQLAGRTLAASQFNESDFFIRYLAREAGVPVRVLRDLDARPGPQEIGLVYYEDAFVACDAYQAELGRSQPRLNGCVGWTPRTDEVIEASQGRAKLLVSNRNLLVVADILTVNKGFADANPKMVRGLVHGLLEGNRQLREQPDQNVAVVARAFGWTEADARDELSRVHLSNLPENLAFFKGTIDAAGSFFGIYQASVLAYGSLIRNPVDGERFVDLTALQGLEKDGTYAGQVVAIAPIRTATQQRLEENPLLSKDIRFFFEPNSAALDGQAKENEGYLDTIKSFLQVSPGSTVLLRGHVDNARIPEFRRQGGDQLVQRMALTAMDLSKQRAEAVRAALIKRHPGIDVKRVEIVGRGWEEPAGADSDLNRRVEVQWFTIE